MSEELSNAPAGDGRRLAAIVFTDVVEYSARMQRDETGTMALVRIDFARMRMLCAQHGGEVLKSTGDGLLLCFSSVVQAVACGLQVQKEFGARPADALQHRIGIHLGDVFRTDGDVTGDGVNIAARMETKARPGTICLSQSVYDAVKGKLPMGVEPLGPQQFKNITEPIAVYLVTPGGTGQRFAAKSAVANIRWWLTGAAFVAAAVWAVFFWPRPAKDTLAAAPAQATPQSEAGRLVAQVRALVDTINTTRDNLALAEQLARKATELEPSSAEAWASLGYVNFYFYLRGWDGAPARLEAARSFASRALALVADQPEALLTLASVISVQHADTAQAEVLFRRALQTAPHDNRIRRSLSDHLAHNKRLPEAIALLQEAVRDDPGDSLAYYTLAVIAVTNWDFPAAWKSVDAALAAHAFASGWKLKAILCANWKGDLPGMRRALERLSPTERTEDRAVYLLMWCSLMERKPERALEAAQLTSRDYFDDLFVRGPKGWFTGRAHSLLGQENLAQLDYATAETVIHARLALSPDNQHDKLCLAITLGLQGRVAEARQEIAPLEAVAREQSPVVQARWLAMFHAVLGDGARAVAYLRQVDDPFGGFVSETPPVLRLDPWWDKLRGQPEFEALLKDPKYCPAVDWEK